LAAVIACLAQLPLLPGGASSRGGGLCLPVAQCRGPRAVSLPGSGGVAPAQLSSLLPCGSAQLLPPARGPVQGGPLRPPSRQLVLAIPLGALFRQLGALRSR
jgi:hypothetical protein